MRKSRSPLGEYRDYVDRWNRLIVEHCLRVLEPPLIVPDDAPPAPCVTEPGTLPEENSVEGKIYRGR